LTVAPVIQPASSEARARVKPMTPPLAATQAAMFGVPAKNVFEAMLMMMMRP
jgi:hypothetical protein